MFSREMHFKQAARRGCDAGLYPLVGRHRGSERHHRGLGAGVRFGLTQTEWFTAPPQGILVGGVFVFAEWVTEEQHAAGVTLGFMDIQTHQYKNTLLPKRYTYP